MTCCYFPGYFLKFLLTHSTYKDFVLLPNERVISLFSTLNFLLGKILEHTRHSRNLFSRITPKSEQQIVPKSSNCSHLVWYYKNDWSQIHKIAMQSKEAMYESCLHDAMGNDDSSQSKNSFGLNYFMTKVRII